MKTPDEIRARMRETKDLQERLIKIAIDSADSIRRAAEAINRNSPDAAERALTLLSKMEGVTARIFAQRDCTMMIRLALADVLGELLDPEAPEITVEDWLTAGRQFAAENEPS